MNILEQFYILFKSDADKARKDNEALEASAVKAAATVDTVAVAHEAAGVAATTAAEVTVAANVAAAASIEDLKTAQIAAAAAAATAARVRLESETAETIAADVAAKGALKLAAARLTEAEATKKAAEAEGVLGAAYVFNRSQRMELTGLARHSIDQLAAGGSIMRVVEMHAATLAEALSNGPGGLAAGFGALAGAAGKFVATWGLPLAAIGGIVAAFGIAKGAVKDLENDRMMSDRVNMDVSDLDALRKAVRNLGGDTKEVDKDLERFANRLDDAFGSATLGGKPDRVAKTMKAIGVSSHDANGKLKDTKAALLDIAGAMEHMSAAKKSETLRNLGFSSPRHGQTDPGIEKLMTGGRAAMLRYIETEKRLGGVTKEQVEQAHKYKLATEILGDRFRDLRNTIAQYVLPVLTDLVNGMRAGIEWMRLNSTLVKGFGLTFVATAVVVAAATWGTLIPAFAAAAVAVLAATWPIIAIGAAVVALAAIFAACYEDVVFFLKGQPSLIGELVNKYEWVRKTVHAIGDAFQWLGREGHALWDKIAAGATQAGAWLAKAFTAALPALRGLWAAAGPVLHFILDAAMAIGRFLGPVLWAVIKGSLAIVAGLVKGVWEGIKAIATLIGAAFAGVAKLIGPIWSDMFKGWLKQLYELIEGVRKLFHMKPDAAVEGALRGGSLDSVNMGQRALGFAGSVPFAALGTQTVGNQMRGPSSRTLSVNVEKVDVHTQATDADRIAAAFSGSLGNEVRRASANFDDGINR